MKKRLLAIDSDERILNSVESLFSGEKSQYDVLTSTSCKPAIELIKNEHPDVIITAIDIKGGDGLEIIKEAKKFTIPVIVLSSRSDEETIEMIKAYYKPDAYIIKPFEPASLMKKIDCLLEINHDIIDELPQNVVKSILRNILDNMDTEITILDREMNILWANKSIQKKGFPLSNIFMHKSYRIFDNSDYQNPDSSSAKAIKDGNSHETIKGGHDGHTYKTTSIPIKDFSGNIKYIIELTDDATAMEAKLGNLKKIT